MDDLDYKTEDERRRFIEAMGLDLPSLIGEDAPVREGEPEPINPAPQSTTTPPPEETVSEVATGTTGWRQQYAVEESNEHASAQSQQSLVAQELARNPRVPLACDRTMRWTREMFEESADNTDLGEAL